MEKTDEGSINRDATLRHLMKTNFSSDSNIQISQQAEILINLYNDLLLQHRTSISSQELEKIINQHLFINEQEISEEEEYN